LFINFTWILRLRFEIGAQNQGIDAYIEVKAKFKIPDAIKFEV
jgi:hypothetical protein